MENKNILIKREYRAEIDGLRALAVFAVIINHFNKSFLPSGYLGVDIFFVISGYVITSSLSKRKIKKFNEFICGFYERRVKRLIPALVFYVLPTSFLICFFNPIPTGHLKTGLISLFGLSNISLFLKSTDYFAPIQELNPYAHTWSLGVEEQFYIFFPFLIWLTGFGGRSQKGSRNLFFVILILIISSLTAFIYFYYNNQSAAYYLMPLRIWEIGSGCLLFLFTQNKGLIISYIKRISPGLIIILMLINIFLPAELSPLPHISITFLTFLLIGSIKKENLTYNFLTNKAVLHFGLISYSLYLWHWGILSISQFTIGIHWWSLPFQFLLIYIFSIISYKFIENPLRKEVWSLNKLITILKGFLTLISSGFVLLILDIPLNGKLYLGNPEAFKEEKYYALTKDPNFCREENKEYVPTTRNLRSAECFSYSRDNKTLFFIGDSHNLAFLKGAEFLAEQTNRNLTFERSILGPIQEGQNKNLYKFLFFNQPTNLIKFVDFALNKSKEGDIVFLNIRMPFRFLETWYTTIDKQFSGEKYFIRWLYALEAFANHLEKKNVKLIVFYPTPEFRYSGYQQCKNQNPQWFNRLSKKDCLFPLDYFDYPNGKYASIIKKINEVSLKHNNLYFFNALEAICPNYLCKYSIGKYPLYKDANHISDYAAEKLIAPHLLRFLKDEILFD